MEPKKIQRGKPAQKLRRELARDFLYSLQREIEFGRGGEELTPAVEYLSLVTRLKIPELVKTELAEKKIGEEESFRLLEDVENKLVKAGFQKSEVRRFRTKLERKIKE